MRRDRGITKNLRITVLILSTLVFLSCGLYLFMIYYPNAQTPEVIVDQDLLFNGGDITSSVDLAARLSGLREINKDLYGWITIKGTIIDYPLLQTSNNDYYLTHNFYQKYDRNGAIYIDSRITATTSMHLLIHGHNMRNGTMFGKLMKFTSEAYYKKHQEIAIITEDGAKIYKIIAAVRTKVNNNDDKAFKYYHYLNVTSEQEYHNYIKNVKKLSLYTIDINPEYGDQIITLSTCIDADSDRRFILVAVNVK